MHLYRETALSRVYTFVMFFKKTLCRFHDSVVWSLASVWMTWYSVRTLISQATSVWMTWYTVQTTRTFRPNLPLCQEASSCPISHPSGCFSSTSGWHSVFDQLCDFFPKHRYRKIAITVRTMWIPVQTRSSIRQVTHSKFRRLDDSIHGLDVRSLNMKNACS
jgi:hypothetical protein